jgi:hypothetical protein
MNQLRLLEIKTVLSGSPDLDREISVAAPTSPVLFFNHSYFRVHFPVTSDRKYID